MKNRVSLNNQRMKQVPNEVVVLKALLAGMRVQLEDFQYEIEDGEFRVILCLEEGGATKEVVLASSLTLNAFLRMARELSEEDRIRALDYWEEIKEDE